MRYLLYVLVFFLLLLIVCLVNFYFKWTPGLPGEDNTKAIVYFAGLSILLYVTARLQGQAKVVIAIFLLLIFPTIFLTPVEDAGGNRVFTIGRILGLGGWLGSTTNLFLNSSVSLMSSYPSADRALAACLGYSIAQAAILIALIVMRTGGHKSPYKRWTFWLYTGIGGALTYLLFDDISTPEVAQDLFQNCLLACALVLFVYLMLRIRKPARTYGILIVILLLFFPTISILPGNYNIITNWEHDARFTGAIGVAPLAFSLPFTLTRLFSDVPLDGQIWPFAVKLYTLLQAGIVFFALPSVLITKTKNIG